MTDFSFAIYALSFEIYSDNKGNIFWRSCDCFYMISKKETIQYVFFNNKIIKGCPLPLKYYFLIIQKHLIFKKNIFIILFVKVKHVVSLNLKEMHMYDRCNIIQENYLFISNF